MIQEWLVIFAGAVTLSAVGFVSVAVMWLKKVRETVAVTLADSAEQQKYAHQKLNDALSKVQRQQDDYARQITVLAQAGIRLQREISDVAERVDNAHGEQLRAGQTLH